MGHDKISNLFAGTCFFVSLSTVPLFGPSSAYALPISLGPYSDTAPFTDIDRMGPNGAQINIVKHPNTFGLTGRLPDGTRVSLGQLELFEPNVGHVAFSDGAGGSRITRQVIVPGVAIGSHPTHVAGVLIGNRFVPVGSPPVNGIASEARLFSAGNNNDNANFIPSANFVITQGAKVINQSATFSVTEIQQVALSRQVTGGEFKLQFQGQNSGVIKVDFSADQVRTALEAHPTINPGDVSVVASPGNVRDRGWEVRFKGQFLGLNVPDMVPVAVNLTGVGATLKVEARVHGEGVNNVNNGNSAFSLFADSSVVSKDVIWVTSAHNEGGHGAVTIGRPADAYNGITVGATGADFAGSMSKDYTRIGNYSSRGTTLDGRRKPDIVAPGSRMLMPAFVAGHDSAVTGDSYSNGIGFNKDGKINLQDPFFDINGNQVRDKIAGTNELEPYFDTERKGIYSGGPRPGPPPPPPGASPDFIQGALVMDKDHNGVIQQPQSGTSYAAPHVAGTAALLIERSREVGLNHDHLTIKSAILNSASKHVRDPQNGNRTWPQFRGESTFYTDPLDNAMGVGQLNGLAAVRQLQRVGQSGLGSTVEKSTIARGEARDEPLNSGRVLHAGVLVTATLTWDREVTLKPGRPGTDQNDYDVRPLPNLNLLLVNGTTGTEVAGSISAVDNVEHIYFNVPTTDTYNLRVVNRSTDQDPTFALAYSAASAEGLSFSVDGGVFNTRPGIPGTQPLPRRGTGISPAPNPAEGLMAPFGNNPYPNDVNALGIAGPGNFPTEGEIFVANCNAISSLTPTCDGRNMQRLSGALGTRSRVGPHNGPPAAMAVLNQGVAGLPAADQRGVLGLQPNDNVVGLSWGTDGTLGQPSVLLFSVDPDTQGEMGDVVFQARVSPMGGAPSNPLPDNPGGGNQFLGQEAAGDIFKSQKFDHFSRTYDSPLLLPAPPRSNRLLIDEEQLGLQAPKGRGSLLGGEEDNLDALEMDSVFVSHPGGQAIDPDGDGLHNEAIFFLLDRWSPSLSNLLGRTPDDIFVSLAPFTNGRFADGETDVGLRRGDALDALVLSDTFPFGLFNNNGDEALFSLDRFSPSVVDGSACSSEVYYTDFNREFRPRIDWKAGGSLFATAEALGLMCTVDDLDALDIRRVFVVPEPSMFAIVVIGLGALVLFLRRRKYEIGRSLGRGAFLSR